MPMVRAMRMLNAIEAGKLTGAQLETLLTTDPGRLAELNQLLALRGQTRRMAASSTAMNAIAASSKALNAVIASSTALNAVVNSSTATKAIAASSTAMNAVAASSTAMNAIYASPTAVTRIMPSAFAVWAPHSSLLTISGSEVSEWRDASGNNRNMVQPTSGNRPTFNGTAFNGWTTLEFDGSNDYLYSSSSLQIPDACTIFIVSQKDSTANYGLFGNNGNDNGGQLIEVSNSLYVDHSGGAYSYSFALNTSPNVRRIISGWGSANTTNLRLNNNAPVQRTDCNLLGNNTNLTCSIGYANDPSWVGSVYFDGKIAEVIILNRSTGPGDPEYDRILNLLRVKYAVW